ncbi:hypothetical protein AA0112_g11924 [Alternaria arborescens]|nr:hypothetical protein AA0112_g11924 [Alternaria arborescens]
MPAPTAIPTLTPVLRPDLEGRSACSGFDLGSAVAETSWLRSGGTAVPLCNPNMVPAVVVTEGANVLLGNNASASSDAYPVSNFSRSDSCH